MELWLAFIVCVVAGGMDARWDMLVATSASLLLMLSGPRIIMRARFATRNEPNVVARIALAIYFGHAVVTTSIGYFAGRILGLMWS
ncbi:MAG: hypothetical protein ACFCUN_00185 [Hyphomicrobiaceae bacterium]